MGGLHHGDSRRDRFTFGPEHPKHTLEKKERTKEWVERLGSERDLERDGAVSPRRNGPKREPDAILEGDAERPNL